MHVALTNGLKPKDSQKTTEIRFNNDLFTELRTTLYLSQKAKKRYLDWEREAFMPLALACMHAVSSFVR